MVLEKIVYVRLLIDVNLVVLISNILQSWFVAMCTSDMFLIEVKRIVSPEVRDLLDELLGSRRMRAGSLFTGVHAEGVTWQVKSSFFV